MLLKNLEDTVSVGEPECKVRKLLRGPLTKEKYLVKERGWFATFVIKALGTG